MNIFTQFIEWLKWEFRIGWEVRSYNDVHVEFEIDWLGTRRTFSQDQEWINVNTGEIREATEQLYTKWS